MCEWCVEFKSAVKCFNNHRRANQVSPDIEINWKLHPNHSCLVINEYLAPKCLNHNVSPASYNPDLAWEDFCVYPNWKMPSKEMGCKWNQSASDMFLKRHFEKGHLCVVRSVSIPSVDSKPFLQSAAHNVPFISFMHLAAFLNTSDAHGGSF